MSSSRTASQVAVESAAQGSSQLRAGATGAAAATLVNAALWLGGRAADVSFAVPDSLVPEVDLLSVVVTTPLVFAAGWWLLSKARARGSRRWEGNLLVGAGAFAVVSAAAPVALAADAASGVLLASMHVLTGAVFVISAEVTGSRRQSRADRG